MSEHTTEKDAGRIADLCCGHLTCQNLVREAMAQAWDEGFDAGERDVFEHETFDEPCIVNPYRVIPPGTGNRQGRPLGAASGGDPGFWDRLGVGEDGLPVHLPMGVNEHGQGPEDDSAAFTYVCWCGDTECPLTLALGHAWASGTKANQEQE